jgi:hypothetical protein
MVPRCISRRHSSKRSGFLAGDGRTPDYFIPQQVSVRFAGAQATERTRRQARRMSDIAVGPQRRGPGDATGSVISGGSVPIRFAASGCGVRC